VPHGDTNRHSVRCVPVCTLSSFLTHFTSTSHSTDFHVFQIYTRIWYSTSSSLDLVGFSNADFTGCGIDRKSTSGTCHFLSSFVCWSSSKEINVAQSTAETEYVAIALKFFGYCIQ
jgi:hypothetical protein